ncbi:MAG: glycosyl hydrolase [Bacteroidota bacterium]
MKKFLLALVLCYSLVFIGQEKKDIMSSSTFSALKFRNIGPAFTSGRIAEIAIDPTNQNIMYVAVGSGNVWKTVNAGTTWEPIFDKEKSYSIGCITIDPNNPHTIWVGTGENVGGRHVGFGDGIYRSTDAGKTWKNMGLQGTQHLSKIIVHPDNSDVIWVAAQGPLWNKGGERGLYKSIDGGKTWKRTLGNDEWTGVTDVVMDPRNPDMLIAATWDRHRTVAAYMGGGPGSGVHRSTDGGESWEKLTEGIPKSNLGKIGLALSPFNPDVVYAAIELDRTTGGLFLSTDRGSSWTKQSDMISGATGPHYYQELYADPHHEGRIYLMNNNVLVSDDHGKTYYRMRREYMHSDMHAVAFRKNDPNYIIMGSDGGIYETFDGTETWRFVGNLPLTQYYKLAVDDAQPFYNIYGGTQDNGSHKGPSRTNRREGILNRDWTKVLGADGHQSATEPGNPDITYGEFQQGRLFRIDHKTGESVFIAPQPGLNEPYERFNWDAPILVSPHDPKRIYFASYRVWRSDNRGDDWEAISGDLTKGLERIKQPIMGGLQSWDNAWDVKAMSNYSTITSLAESPIKEGLLYAGTDDGVIQVTEDGGTTWRKVAYESIRGLPATAFVNDVRADLFEANTVYAALDNHKYGDFKPYIIKSTDAGKTWRLINGDLPNRLLVWRMVQDHVNKNLMFLATEFGIYFTINGGANWIQLKGGLPTLSFRDITIQRRENDVVAASFGRGFYVLDDYSALRSISQADLEQNEALLFKTRKADWYIPVSDINGSHGAQKYRAKNPEFGATFTYYLRDAYTTLSKNRKEREKKATTAGQDIPFPGWDAIEQERRQEAPKIVLTITDSQGNIVKTLSAKPKKGMNRTSWDLSTNSKNIVQLDARERERNFFGPSGTIVTPGTYSVSLSKVVDGVTTPLAAPQQFEVVRMLEPAVQGASAEEFAAFKVQYDAFQQSLSATNMMLKKAKKKVTAMRKAFLLADQQPDDLSNTLFSLASELEDLDTLLNGNKSKDEVGANNAPTPGDARFIAGRALRTTYGPTGTHKKALDRATQQLGPLESRVKAATAQLSGLLQRLEAIGAPKIEE